jgi:hypothetical protein
MSGTALDHPLVRDYLHELDLALSALPAGPAGELREQITAHLDDAIAAGASDDAVAEVLRRLGGPAELAAEAAATAGAGAATAPPPAEKRERGPIARIRVRTWLVTGLALAVVVAVAGRWADYYLSAYPLTYDQGADWWYQQDSSREVMSYANNTSQSTVPIRSGQRQGYIISVYNGSPVTETIVGDANSALDSSGDTNWNNPGSGTEQVTVSAAQIHIPGGFAGQNVVGKTAFTLPVSIPPDQTRVIRVLWTSDLCLSQGETNGTGGVAVRVQVGWFTRTQVIAGPGWYLTGPSHGHCAG